MKKIILLSLALACGAVTVAAQPAASKTQKPESVRRRARLALGERIGRHEDPVVHAPRDQGPIGVALQELDDHLPPHARQDHRTARLLLGDADPARA